jgi:murein DD-endopeptidase MepM/ murein hydrolase activator NlpD
MNNSTSAKRQTRATAVIVTVILAAVVVLVLFSTMQHRREEAKPPVQTEAGTSSETVRTAETRERIHRLEESEPAEIKKPADTEKEKETETEPESAHTAAEKVLPDFIAPVSGIVSKAYSIEIPVYSLTMEDYRTHSGIDIAAELGVPVRASAAGTVENIWEEPMMGTCLSLVHAGGARSVYKNLAPVMAAGIEAGVTVQTGEILGTVGESALAEIAESPHLHYGLYVDGISVDPSDFMLCGNTDTSYEG